MKSSAFGLLILASSLALAQAAKQISEPVAMAAETVRTSATVTAIDPAKRLVKLRAADGAEVVVKGGEEVRNLAQVKVGDIVNAEYRLAAIVSLKHAAGMRSATQSTSVARAKAGDHPAQTVKTEGSIVADVISVDAEKGTLSVKGPKGRVIHGKVADKAVLQNVKVGDQVELNYSESLALKVVAASPATPAKK